MGALCRDCKYLTDGYACVFDCFFFNSSEKLNLLQVHSFQQRFVHKPDILWKLYLGSVRKSRSFFVCLFVSSNDKFVLIFALTSVFYSRECIFYFDIFE